jgi:CTP:molybdopterin cytidylyltransferase MocA
MKTLILAAGRGSRMGDLTARCPKPLLLLHGRPLLEHLLRAVADAGLRDVVVAVGYLADQIVNHFGDGHDLGLCFAYRRVEGLPPEAVVLAERDHLVPDESLLCLTGDSVISAAQIRQMLDLFGSSRADAVVTVESGGASDLRVTVEGSRVTGASHSPSAPVLAYNMVMRQSFLEALARWSAEPANLAFARAMNDLAPRHTILVADVGRIVNVNWPCGLIVAQDRLCRAESVEQIT